ncbi:unnamed protein product [Musa acuminata subsp. burmannicoides]
MASYLPFITHELLNHWAFSMSKSCFIHTTPSLNRNRSQNPTLRRGIRQIFLWSLVIFLLPRLYSEEQRNIIFNIYIERERERESLRPTERDQSATVHVMSPSKIQWQTSIFPGAEPSATKAPWVGLQADVSR